MELKITVKTESDKQEHVLYQMPIWFLIDQIFISPRQILELRAYCSRIQNLKLYIDGKEIKRDIYPDCC